MQKRFPRTNIICGVTIAEIIASKLKLEIEIQHGNKNLDKLPPNANMAGFEMVTEGILILGKVEEILDNFNNDTRLGDSLPEKVVKLLLQRQHRHDCGYSNRKNSGAQIL